MTFIDDFSRKPWVYLLNKKFEDFDIFKRFKVMVEKESGKYIKVLRSNIGGDYMLTDFMEFCEYHGMKRLFATRYTPQQNVVAKRKNRTIMNMARSMLKEKHLPNDYWGNAVVFFNIYYEHKSN
jgi:transposase InsO family protein